MVDDLHADFEALALCLSVKARLHPQMWKGTEPCPSFPCFLFEKGKESHQQKNKGWLSLRDSETTIKIKFALLRGLGEGVERRIVQEHWFSWETPRQYNLEIANFIVEKCCCHCAGS